MRWVTVNQNRRACCADHYIVEAERREPARWDWARAAPLTTVVVQQTFNAPVANAGTVYGNVTQNVALPPMPSDVRAKLMESPAGEALVEALDEESAQAQPRPDKIQKLVAGIKSLMETTNTVSEFWQHFTEWSTEVAAWLGDTVGSIGDTLV